MGLLQRVGRGRVREVRFLFALDEKWAEQQVFEELEVCSCSGNVAIREGKPFVHTHAVQTLGSDDLDERGCLQRMIVESHHAPGCSS
jgi:predicted DNA-binding protein with PD1-like motif